MASNITTPMTMESYQQELAHLKQNMDHFFLVTMSVVIYLMQCGFAFLEAGSVQSKNTTNILLKNLIESLIGGILYWAVGWAFAYGRPSNAFIGHGQFFDPPPDKYPLWFFQFVFAATTSTIVSGAVSERCEFVAFILYSIVLTGFVYPVVTHWAWDTSGWLRNLGGTDFGFKDFAGSGVVHVVGGVFSFVGAFLLGPRIGRFPKNGPPKYMPGHSVALVALGGFILLFGFFAFNGGSLAQISSPGDGIIVARAMFNTIISAASAAFVTILFTRIRFGKWSILVTINGALAGAVAICAGCDVVRHWGACAIGTGAGLMYMLVSLIMVLIRVDDPLDAVAVHFGGGMWGVLMRPLFDANEGVWFNFNRRSGLYFAWNFIGLVSIMAWSAFWAFLVFGIMKLCKILRVTSEVEIKGLDIFKHGEPTYPAAAYGHGWDEENEGASTEDEKKTHRDAMNNVATAVQGQSGKHLGSNTELNTMTMANSDNQQLTHRHMGPQPGQLSIAVGAPTADPYGFHANPYGSPDATQYGQMPTYQNRYGYYNY